jgi:hypothetical protein
MESDYAHVNMKILVFTEGTIIMHKNASGLSRKQIVKQVAEGKDPRCAIGLLIFPLEKLSRSLMLGRANKPKFFILHQESSVLKWQ